MEVCWENILDGSAWIEFPPESRVALANLAGAPWSPEDPGARLSPAQENLLRDENRTVIRSAGMRAGKTATAAAYVLSQVAIPKSSIGIVCHKYEHGAKQFAYLMQGFSSLFGRDAATVLRNNTRTQPFSMYLETFWGSTVKVTQTASDAGENLLGTEFDLVSYEEGSKVDSEVHWSKVDPRTKARAKKRRNGKIRRTGKVLAFTTPDELSGAPYAIMTRALEVSGNNLESLRVENGCGWMESLSYEELSTLDLNPAYPIEIFESNRRYMTDAQFAQEMLGKPRARAGKVLGEFTAQKCVIRNPDISDISNMKLALGMDTGRHFAVTLLGMDFDHRIRVLEEIKTVDLNFQSNCETVKDAIAMRLKVQSWKEAASMISFLAIDTTSQFNLDAEQHLGIQVYEQKYDVANTLSRIDTMFRNGMLFISEDCHQLIQEIENYRWKVARSLEAAITSKPTPMGSDHLIDAMRYCAMALMEYGPPKKQEDVRSIDELLKEKRDRILIPNINDTIRIYQMRQLQKQGGIF